MLFLITVLIIICVGILIFALTKLLQGDVNTARGMIPIVIPSLIAGVIMFGMARKI